MQLAASDPEWVIPDLFFPEVANVLWKKVRRYEMAEEAAREVLILLLSIAIRVREAKSLIPYALEVAIEFECSVYDGLYLAVAIDENCPLVIADRKFYSIFSKKALGNYLLWIEDAL